MPNVNCCVPSCIASTRRTPNLSFYRLPKDKANKDRWNIQCRNSNLKKGSKWTSVCSLHFVGGCKTYDIQEPTIFPWSDEWKDVIQNYNASLEQWNSVEKCSIKPLELPDKVNLPRVYKSSSRKIPRSTLSITKRALEAKNSIDENIEEVNN